ncbi:MAG: SRPBCC domain-containing protein [Bacteroidetes bacterium]|nr:SRPBCC domain-containing protein [Bacteroidota bacterium]
MSEERIKTKVQMGILKPAHEVFEAIVDPDKMNKYFITTSTGRMESAKTLTWSWEDYDASHEVKVQNVEKDKLVSFTWEGSGVECLVVITLEPKGENQTLVKITESDWPADFQGAARCMGQVEGWTNFLCCLKAYLEYGVNLRVGGVIK